MLYIGIFNAFYWSLIYHMKNARSKLQNNLAVFFDLKVLFYLKTVAAMSVTISATGTAPPPKPVSCSERYLSLFETGSPMKA
jgi:hypothetical protein